MKSSVLKNLTTAGVPPIAFFCAEYAITLDESMYAGGLGVLAGDFLFEAGQQKMPLVALGLKYTKTKIIDNGFELLTNPDGTPIIVEVLVGDKVGAKKIFLRSWIKSFSEKTFLFLLDSDLPNNSPEDRVLGDLYDQNFFTRLKQEMYLGIGGFRLLKALGIEPKKYHLNEGSAAFAALAVLAEGFSMPQKSSEELLRLVRTKVVSTKHTILSVGTKIPIVDLWKVIGAYCEMHGISRDFLMSLGAHKKDESLSATTRFLISLSDKSNGVSIIHTVFEKQKYPESQLIPITNGVHVPRWQSPRWREEGDVSDLSSEKIWTIKKELRTELVDEVKKLSGIQLDPNVCTLVWTRRFVSYKRPMALFSDMKRLQSIIANSAMPLQIILSGKKAGANDTESIKLMEKVRTAAADPMFANKIVFVPDYTLAMAEKFVHGADVWLNTPERGVEACGTSGMKAALNGALMTSVSDGWMDEVKWEGIGWILANEDKDLAPSLYDALEHEILPKFYQHDASGVPEEWIKRMRATMNIVSTDFSATKMLQGYEEKLYS